jgi:hypothetical protein
MIRTICQKKKISQTTICRKMEKGCGKAGIGILSIDHPEIMENMKYHKIILSCVKGMQAMKPMPIRDFAQSYGRGRQCVLAFRMVAECQDGVWNPHGCRKTLANSLVSLPCRREFSCAFGEAVPAVSRDSGPCRFWANVRWEDGDLRLAIGNSQLARAKVTAVFHGQAGFLGEAGLSWGRSFPATQDGCR